MRKQFKPKSLKGGKLQLWKVQALDILTILAIAFGLAIDAFSVSVALGVTLKGNSGSNALKMAFSFGAFQAFMPLLGWFAGTRMLDFISGVDHWLAFALLLLVG